MKLLNHMCCKSLAGSLPALTAFKRQVPPVTAPWSSPMGNIFHLLQHRFYWVYSVILLHIGRSCRFPMKHREVHKKHQPFRMSTGWRWGRRLATGYQMPRERLTGPSLGRLVGCSRSAIGHPLSGHDATGTLQVGNGPESGQSKIDDGFNMICLQNL